MIQQVRIKVSFKVQQGWGVSRQQQQMVTWVPVVRLTLLLSGSR
jgi:hypothetical protein